MKFSIQYNINTQLWEFAVMFEKDGNLKGSYVYARADQSQPEIYKHLENWLNQVSREYDKETSPSQQA